MSASSTTLPEIRRNGGRRSTACQRCHKQKVKCSRERPCRNCQSARVDCVYAGRDKLLTVPESYLRSLEADRGRFQYSPQLSSHTGIEDEGTITSDTRKDSFGHHTVENSAAEAFLAKVNQLRHDTTFSAASDPSPVEPGVSNDSAKSSLLSSSYDYFRLAFDTSHSPISLNLPPYPYANHLLEQMEIYMGHDYHWFLRRRFKERMDSTYKTSGSLESRDRLWLCRLLIVFALGETFVNYHTPVIHLGPTTTQSYGQDPQPEQLAARTPPPPPGTTFFEQALVLLKLPFEEPSLEHIEILNLAASLTRSQYDTMPRTCMLPSQIKLDYPTDQQLEPGDADQFFEADFLRARIQLTLMKAEADIFIDLWQSIRDDIPDGERRVRPILLKLENWLHELPASLKFDCEAGMPEAMTQAPNTRSLASLYLRWQQCFILLLRPFFLKQITYIVSDELSEPYQDHNLKVLSDTCIRAARSNLSIEIGLWRRERIAKFGFWDSLHLFSSLTIFSLAISVNRRRPGSFDEKDTDPATYSTAKDLLHDLVKAGNLASKGHEKMLQDVEALGEVLGSMQTNASDFMLEQWDMDNWMAQVLSMDSSSLPFYGFEEG
ncbi:hypothetical protein FSARC_13281 [Fusarium sarcochroum]|uniref:Zn(2)-C6 fungal-type domain-containing protein n=1 Tax=Fusarium sarcochroum TaxID=1208366 RepID=A0A8H4T2L8_9HYPO|nr:hypothetical protein FSARC_13281 [Fusarium sarcochroum]